MPKTKCVLKCKPKGRVVKKALAACPIIKKIKDEMKIRSRELKRLRKVQEKLEELQELDEIKLQLLMPEPGAFKKGKVQRF
jgi:hypothetical protein